MYWSTWQETGKKKSRSQTGIEPMTSWTLGGHFINWSTRTHGERGHLTEFISDRHPCIALGSALLKIVSSNKWIKIWWILRSVTKIWKVVLINTTQAWDKENLLGTKSLADFLCPMLVSCWTIHLSQELNSCHSYFKNDFQFRERKNRKSTPPSSQ